MSPEKDLLQLHSDQRHAQCVHDTSVGIARLLSNIPLFLANRAFNNAGGQDAIDQEVEHYYHRSDSTKPTNDPVDPTC